MSHFQEEEDFGQSADPIRDSANSGGSSNKRSSLSDTPSAAKIEDLRDFCETQLGDDLFMKVYRWGIPKNSKALNPKNSETLKEPKPQNRKPYNL
jgi:hypothetical protein